MMRSTISVLAAALVFAFLLVGCDNVNNPTDLNEDPTAPTSMEPGLQFAEVPLGITDTRFEGWRANLIHAECITQHLASTTTAWSGCYYTLNEGYNTAYWNRKWSSLRNIEDILAKTNPEENPEFTNIHAMTRILRVFVMHRMTDLYGAVPYEQAGKGVTEEIENPEYDAPSEIYPAMIEDLQEARGQLDPSVSTLDPGRDLLFAGDIQKWEKFANSMILRLGMRMSEVAPDQAQAAVQDALNSGVMESNDDIAYVEHVETNGDRWGVGEVFQDFGVGGHAFRVSKTLMDILTGEAGVSPDMDPRTNIFTAQYADDGSLTTENPASLEGFENGLQPEEFPDNTFQFAQPHRSYMVQYSSPSLFQSYGEVKFLEAEAALRGWHPGSGDARQHYEEGIEAAMKHLTIYGAPEIAQSEIDDYLNSLPARAPTLEEIIEQKWIALFLNGYEAWAEFRRTGYPDEVRTNPVNAPASETPQDEFPGRLVYPTNEKQINPNFTEEATTSPDEMSTRLWWARDPGETATP
ncbi:hypothetical protein GGP55_001485 [Salinibacter ruber]|uniref:SusD/RagB family nutrient-binding outer membrane lipoprotein n=1 Tax=Salinibacter ruber TaxID=146919 RepID=UPI002073F2A1|nr:SusD/RagB family nutrient-binding outer membrane lipoprotein [Salinibacter ruber]MCS3630886.1 hypothetical protein [Salinibacter ruber]MCS3640816.1 hypothetical protein [Salinibacter ruber]MCS4114345.1 hypothetical protein [Salinibacter ruber]MCS4179991.1 hypothetical protein [Salinibacter ruber]